MGVIIKRATCSLLLVALCYTNAVAQNVAQGQASTPTSISNSEFWSIISRFSEPGGNFPSDNYTSNELMIGQVASDIIARGKTGGAYLGVGPEQNFTYIAALKPEIVFIVDIRRQAVMQHLMYKAIFEMSGNRSEFIARLFSKPLQTMTAQDTAIRDIWSKYLPVAPDSALYEKNIAAIHDHLARVRGFALLAADSASIALVYNTFYRYGPYISYSSRAGGSLGAMPSVNTATFLSLTLITDTTGVPRSFLATDANYQFVRGLHSKNLFIPVVGDVGGPRALRMVGDFLREHRTIVSGYYPSNVEQYLFRPPTPGGNGGWQEFYTSVGLMPLDSASVFIRSNGLRVNNARVVQQGRPQPAMAPDIVWRSTVVGQPPTPPTPPAPPARPAEVQAATMPTQQPNLGALTGTIRDSATGNPLQSATVVIAGTASGATTNANGQYTIGNVAPGIYNLNIRRVGYAPASAADVRVAAGAPTVVDVRAIAQAVNLTGVAPVGSASPNDVIQIRNPTTGALYGFTVVRTGGSLTSISGSSGVVFCPMLEFLAAFKAGRVTSYADATRCPR